MLMRLAFTLSVLLMLIGPSPAQVQTSNLPPEVSILWPRTNCSGYSYNRLVNPGTLLKIKASATDADGSIAQMQFFADSNLIGVVSNAPFSVIWKVPGPPRFAATSQGGGSQQLGWQHGISFRPSNDHLIFRASGF